MEKKTGKEKTVLVHPFTSDLCLGGAWAGGLGGLHYFQLLGSMLTYADIFFCVANHPCRKGEQIIDVHGETMKMKRVLFQG